MDDQIVLEVKAKVINHKWQLHYTDVKKFNENQVVALELDPENTQMTDSIYTYDRDLIIDSDHHNEIPNKLFLLDGKEDIYKIV